MEAFKSILENSSLIFVVLTFGALSGLISERAGIINVGIEGMMTMGALIFAVFAKSSGSNLGNWSQILALLCAGLMGILFSGLHAFASITLKADQIVSGVAINILAAAIALFVVQLPGNNGFITFNTIYFLPKLGSSEFFNIYLLFAIIAIVAIGFALKYTKWGIRHIAVGENPNAADVVGINVIKKRYSAVFLSGFLAAIAGAVFTMYASGTFRAVVNGNGFLALAILIFGQWRVLLITVGAALFAIVETTAAQISFQTGVSEWFVKNKELFNTLPFVVSLLVLIFTSKWSKAPKALGVAFNKSKR